MYSELFHLALMIWMSQWLGSTEICSQSQSRSLMMSTTQEHWQLFGAWLSRWAGLLCMFTLHHTSSACLTTEKPTHLLHAAFVSCRSNKNGHYCINMSWFSPLTASHGLYELNKLNFDLRGSDLPQLQESWGELVSDKSACVGVAVLLITC